jgi:hypothetical protein
MPERRDDQATLVLYPGLLIFPRIPHLDPADAPKGRGNAGETADSRFHPSRPLGLGHLIWRKVLAHQRKLVHEAG